MNRRMSWTGSAAVAMTLCLLTGAPVLAECGAQPNRWPALTLDQVRYFAGLPIPGGSLLERASPSHRDTPNGTRSCSSSPLRQLPSPSTDG